MEVGDPERLDRERLAWLAGVADDVLVVAADVDGVAERARALREAFGLAGRDPGSLGVAVRLPVSIGRTVAEAAARWDAEPAFAALGPPARAGCSAPWSTATSGSSPWPTPASPTCAACSPTPPTSTT